MQKAELLFELGTEELPPKALKSLAFALKEDMAAQLRKAELDFDGICYFATPRRLALRVNGLDCTQSDRDVEKRGPALKAAFNDRGEPTKAAMGFAASCGVDVSQLRRLETDKGAWVVCRVHQPGQATADLLPQMLHSALAALPIPKRMRWGANRFQFVRPVHWIVLIFDGKVIPGEMFGLPFGRLSFGHRFHHPHPVVIEDVAAYVELLIHANVMADFDARREAIRSQVLALAQQLHGAVDMDEALLDEVAGLVEWPHALVGRFEERFLEVPGEALVAAMKGHQRYFHLLDDNRRVMPYFITVSNIESLNEDAVRGGNERVIRPRLTDAEFFWLSDRKNPLREQLARLKDVVFQRELGSLYDKTVRVEQLSVQIASQMQLDAGRARLAAQLCKCDLLSNMVNEFPELQGIMGRYYALHDGVDAAVADALLEHYLPRGAGDQLPASALGRCLAIADRVDTLVGLFAAGKVPTGDKDPYALRRAALGILRLLIESKIDLDLAALLQSAAEYFPKEIKAQNAVDTVFDFMMERLRAYYGELRVPVDVFEAVLERRPVKITDFDLRIHAVNTFRRLPEAESLAAANKRIRNILKKAEDAIPDQYDPALLREPAEKALAQALRAMTDAVHPMLEARDYENAMCKLAGLRAVVDAFFDAVMVMVDDKVLRVNRLALLKHLSALFLRIADVSRLQ